MAFGQVPYPAGVNTFGREVSVIANGPVRYKVGGCVIDWTNIQPAASQTTIPQSGRVIRQGDHYLRFGTVLCRLTATGKFVPFSAPMAPTTLNGAVVAGARTANLTSASNVNPGDTLRIAAGGGTLEDIVVQGVNGAVVTFATALQFNHADTTAVTKPDDGRQTLRRGECYIMDHTVVLEQDLMSDQAPAVFDGGTVYLARVASDFGSGGVATNPTRSQLEAAFPGVTWVLD